MTPNLISLLANVINITELKWTRFRLQTEKESKNDFENSKSAVHYAMQKPFLLYPNTHKAAVSCKNFRYQKNLFHDFSSFFQ